MRRKLVIACVVLAVVAGLVTLAWHVFDFPPPRLLLKYGLPPAGGPTGRTKTIAGMEFVEVAPGYGRMTVEYFEVSEAPWWLDLLSAVSLGPRPTSLRVRDVQREVWFEVPHSYWITRRTPSIWAPGPAQADQPDVADQDEGALEDLPLFSRRRITIEAVKRVDRRVRGTCRLPSLDEWLYLASALPEGGFGSWELVHDPARGQSGDMAEWKLNGEVAEVLTFESNLHWPSVRLVWIPPEEE